MPYYNYICIECNHEWEDFKKISEREIPMKQPCPNCKVEGKIETRLYESAPIGDVVRLGMHKPDSAFKERMQMIHERTPGSRLDKTSTITKI